MIQWLACEVRSCKFQPDLYPLTFQGWFHESCLNLCTRPPSRFPSPEFPEEDNRIAEVERDDTSHLGTSSSGLFPLITAEEYDALVCRSCVSQILFLQAWAGTPGVAMVVRESPDSSWKIIGALAEDDPIDVDRPRAESNVSPVAWNRWTWSTYIMILHNLLSEDTYPSRSLTDTLQGKKRSLFNSSLSADGPSVKPSMSGMSSEFSQRRAWNSTFICNFRPG
jgi:hypothetical protein